MRSRLAVHSATLAWASLIAVLLLLPGEVYDAAEGSWLDRVLSTMPLVDKLAHGVLFGVMAWLTWRSFALLDASGRVLPAAVSASLYGVSLELLQSLIPGRMPGVPDMIANTVGAFCGAIMAASMAGSPIRKERLHASGRDSGIDGSKAEEVEP